MAEEVAVGPEVVDDDPAGLERAAALLRAGGLVAFPTETVYGLGASIERPAALRRVFEAKGRPTADPLIVHVADVDAARSFAGDWPDAAQVLAERCWPGPLTVVVARPPGLDDLVCAGGSTVGVRVPAPVATRTLLTAVTAPVAAPSANRFGRISPTTAAHVVAEFGGDDVTDRPDLVVDGGPCRLGVESTVVDVTGPVPVVLRPGGVGVEDIERWLGAVEVRQRLGGAGPHVAPGGYLAHYAPSRPLVVLDAGAGTVDRVVAHARSSGLGLSSLDLPGDPSAAASALYRRLRSLDEQGGGPILAELLPPGGVGRAVNDRLYRAAHGRLVVVAADDPADEVLAAVVALVGG